MVAGHHMAVLIIGVVSGYRQLSLAHVENVSSPAVSSLLRWWCGTQGHKEEPLCARHEISLRISVAYGTERLELMQRRQRLLGQGVQRELQMAIDAYCNSTAAQAATAAGVGDGGGGGGDGGLVAGTRPVICGSEHGGQTVPPSKAEQVVQMNDYWCTQRGRNTSLTCRRHWLQQRHQQANSTSEREGVKQMLEQMLTSAAPEALADMREETRLMRQAYCALPVSHAIR